MKIKTKQLVYMLQDWTEILNEVSHSDCHEYGEMEK